MKQDKFLLLSLSLGLALLFLFVEISFSKEPIDLGTYKVVETNRSIEIQKIPEDNGENSKMEVRSNLLNSDQIDPNRRISNNFIIEKVGERYFNEHFEFKEIQERAFFTLVIYDFNYDKYTIEMFIAVTGDGEILPQFSHILKEPQIISFDERDAERTVDGLNLPKPRKIGLIYSEKERTLAWKVEWDQEPTLEERINGTRKGYILDVNDGEIIEELKFEIEVRSELVDKIPFTKIPLILIPMLAVGLIILKKKEMI